MLSNGAAKLGADRGIAPSLMTGRAKANEVAKGVEPPASRLRAIRPLRSPRSTISRRKGTAEALELFIARHDGDRLAQKLRVELQSLSR